MWVVLLVAVAVFAAAVRYAADSRDGRDWTPRLGGMQPIPVRGDSGRTRRARRTN